MLIAVSLPLGVQVEANHAFMVISFSLIFHSSVVSFVHQWVLVLLLHCYVFRSYETALDLHDAQGAVHCWFWSFNSFSSSTLRVHGNSKTSLLHVQGFLTFNVTVAECVFFSFFFFLCGLHEIQICRKRDWRKCSREAGTRTTNPGNWKCNWQYAALAWIPVHQKVMIKRYPVPWKLTKMALTQAAVCH